MPRAVCHFCIKISILVQSCGMENSAARGAIKAVGQPIRFLFTMRGILLNRLKPATRKMEFCREVTYPRRKRAGLVRIRDYGDGIIGFGPGPDG